MLVKPSQTKGEDRLMFSTANMMFWTANMFCTACSTKHHPFKSMEDSTGSKDPTSQYSLQKISPFKQNE